MLQIVRDEKLFEQVFYRNSIDDPMQQWRTHLSPLEISRFAAFANTGAGRVFVEETFAIRRSLHYELSEISRWPAPDLNKPYIVDIIRADGVLKFPNRVLRGSLIRELSAPDE